MKRVQSWQRGSARSQMQKSTASKVHGGLPQRVQDPLIWPHLTKRGFRSGYLASLDAKIADAVMRA